MFHLQLPGGLPLGGALLSQPLLFLVLQLLGDADVVLHELVLLNVGGVIVLNCKREMWGVGGGGVRQQKWQRNY